MVRAADVTLEDLVKDLVEPGYTDAGGDHRVTPEDTRRKVRDALSCDRTGRQPLAPLFAYPGEALPFDGPFTLVLEDGRRRAGRRGLPLSTPFGYHRLEQTIDGGVTSESRLLVVAPRVCFLPPRLRTWGFAVQLYGLRSSSSWGHGDLSDLRRFADAARRLGAGVLLLSPIDAVAPVTPQPTSPYSPTSRIYRNPLYLDVTAMPGFAELRAELPPTGDLDPGPWIRRDDVLAAKLRVLGRLFDRFEGSRRFDLFTRREGRALHRFATFCALAEIHGGDFRTWPAPLRDVEDSAVATFQREHARRIRFFAWLQFHLDAQLTRARRALGLVFDLPVGVDPGGADAWAFPGAFAAGLSVGAPPDALGPEGQDWGLAGFSPQGLEAAQYEPFIRMVRAALRHAAGLRIDHVMGLFRLYMIPRGSPSTEGAYVRSPHRPLLDLLCLESHRARAFIVGEDLGTVDPSHREELARRRVLSYRVAYFEPDRPSRYPRDTLAAVNTHDLPTVAGVVGGADVAERRSLGVAVADAREQALRRHVLELAAAPDDAAPEDVIRAVHAELARAPSRVRLIALEDAVASPARPNVPGLAGPPSFCRPLPVPVEELERHPLLLELARLFRDSGQSSGPGARVSGRSTRGSRRESG